MSPQRLVVVQLLPALVSGGVERGTLEIARALVAAGHRSIVISAGGPLVTRLVAEGSEHIVLPLHQKTPLVLYQVPRLRRLLAAMRADIVHARSRLPAWIAWLALRGMPAAIRPRFVTTVHGLHSVSCYSAIMTRGEVVIAVSETARRYIEDHYACPAERIAVIHRGVDAAAFPYGYRPDAAWLGAWLEQYPSLRNALVITIAGRITRRKGHDVFLRLIAALRRSGLPAHGLIVGPQASGRLARELRRTIARQRLVGAITFTGIRDDIRDVLASSNLVVSLSLLPESFGRTTLEALALGVPVLGWNHGGVGEILAALFPEGSVTPFDESKLVQRAQELLREGRRPAPRADQFSLTRMCEETLAQYHAVVESA